MKIRLEVTRRNIPCQKGITLLELIMSIAILLILSSAALPVFRQTIVRQRETELRRDLREMRNAIDRYKDLADKNLIHSAVGSNGYPPDLETLVKGVNFGPTDRVRFLRRIPVDPMTGQKEWNVQSLQDSPDTQSSDGSNLFDIHSKSQAIAIDGTAYSTW
ncbi:MAG TPA: type II secretion system protein [Candidatus Saccharimonadales bacterium]|jgi:general secretion pathway protein G|nr:type II secretion system protein [Candidatus Saccharimonadales bacterium]